MKRNQLLHWLIRNSILALAILVVAKTGIVSGIRCDDGLTLVVVVLLLSALNAVLRPLLLLIAMPLIVATFGLFLIPAIWLANAFVLHLVGHSIGLSGFRVESFASAMWGSLWISIVAFLLSRFLGGDKPGAPRGPGRKRDSGGDNIIDV